MGEYFVWVNASKGEFLDQHACDDYGWMFSIASLQSCSLTEAACTLIEGPWRGDAVMYAGDYLSLDRDRPCDEPVELAQLFGSLPYERCFDGSYAELCAPDEIIRYRYAVNHSRREFVDRDDSPRDERHEGIEGDPLWCRFDPIPTLFSPPSYGGSRYRGRWCLDDVAMSNEAPPEGYEDITLPCFEDRI